MRALVPRTVELRSGPLTVLEAADPGLAFDVAIEAQAPPPYGAVLWATAVELCRVLEGTQLRGKRVLELGSGCGLCSLVCARAGASVLATDVDEDALIAVLRAAAAQALDVQTQLFDVTGAETLPAHDVCVIADLLYEAPLADAVARRVLESHRLGARVIVGDPDRDGRKRFLQALVDAGHDVHFVGSVLVLEPA